jgi:hypothetical protein
VELAVGGQLKNAGRKVAVKQQRLFPAQCGWFPACGADPSFAGFLNDSNIRAGGIFKEFAVFLCAQEFHAGQRKVTRVFAAVKVTSFYRTVYVRPTKSMPEISRTRLVG